MTPSRHDQMKPNDLHTLTLFVRLKIRNNTLVLSLNDGFRSLLQAPDLLAGAPAPGASDVWSGVRQWVVFSDLHVSAKCAKPK